MDNKHAESDQSWHVGREKTKSRNRNRWLAHLESAAVTGQSGGRRWRVYILAASLVFLATLLELPLRPFITPANLVMFYLAVVMITAVWLGRRPAIMASILSVIAFDFIFVPPYYTFVVADAAYILTFFGLLAVGLVISTLAARAQEQALAARRREGQTAVLYELSQGLAIASTLLEIAQTTVKHSHTAFNSPVALFLPDKTGENLVLRASTPDYSREKDEDEALKWVLQHGQPNGRFTQPFSQMNGFYLPLQISGEMIGVLAINFKQEHKGAFTDQQRRYLTSFSSQVALALEKVRLAEQVQQAYLLEETEKLQTTLLNSISHDLRTPLVSITGALSSLLEDANLLSEEAQHDLLYTAWEQSLHLNRLVGNLLDMTRLESGAMKVVSQPYDVQELVGATLAQMPHRLQGRTVNRTVPNELPAIDIDLTLMIQALMNLLDNALKYAPPEKPIDIEAYQEAERVTIAVKDRGPGLPEAGLTYVFDKFLRLGSDGIGGTGLGLSIAKGIVEAHHGHIWAENRPGGGASFVMSLPIAKEILTAI